MTIAAEQDAKTFFAQNGYAVVRAFLAPALTDFFWQYVRMRAAFGLLTHRGKLVPTAPAAYGDAAFETLLETARPTVEAVAGCRLLPTYSIVRVYSRGEMLHRHRDRPACEISVTVNVGQIPDAPWPIHIAGAKGDGTATLSPGDAMIYRGVALKHWREAYPGAQLGQVFLHYVDRDGPYAAHKFDGRPSLMRPKTGGGEDDI